MTMKFTVEGVFPALVNNRAFLDKVVVSIKGRRRDVPELELRKRVNRPIGGSGRKYAALEQGVLASSGNSYDLVYGRMQLVKILPSLVLTLHSDGAPVTVAEIVATINGICKKGWIASVSLVELTFDFAGLSTEWFRYRVFSSAHKYETVTDEDGNETHYFGGRTSPLQAKVYQKTKNVTRLEFTLRRPFLRQQGITEPSELEKLCTVDFSRRLWLRELDKAALKSLENSVVINRDVRRRALNSFAESLAHREFVPVATKYFHGVPSELLTESQLEKQLWRMQSRLVV
jgi:hypothetical protein